MPDLEEEDKTGFQTANEVHPSNIVDGGSVNGHIDIKQLRSAIPPHCFRPSLLRSLSYLLRDLAYSTVLTYFFFSIPSLTSVAPYTYLRYPLYIIYGIAQGIVWSGLWVLAHECGHSSFSSYSTFNDFIGWTIHSFLLAPYFSWKSTHRHHHIYANHMEKDNVYVPPSAGSYAAQFDLAISQLSEMGEDAPLVLFLRIILQQAIGWNWYILSNITAPNSSSVKTDLGAWRQSHFDPWGALFRESEIGAILLGDLGCGATLVGLWALYKWLGSAELVFWLYVVPWTWVNHWVVMITYLHHTHPNLPKFSPSSWTFTLGATATMDRDFPVVGVHFFHNISSDHVVHHLFSKIPHYHCREATNAIVPLLGNQYAGRGTFKWSDLTMAFTKCQWVTGDEGKDLNYFGTEDGGEKGDGFGDGKEKKALWYKGGKCPPPQFKFGGSGRTKEDMSEESKMGL